MLHAERGLPVVLMEQRIARDPATGRAPTADDRLAFGAKLIRIMGEAYGPRGQVPTSRIGPRQGLEHDPVAGLAGADVVEGLVDVGHREDLDDRPDPLAGGEVEHLRGVRRAADLAAADRLLGQERERRDLQVRLRDADQAPAAPGAGARRRSRPRGCRPRRSRG